MKQLLSISILFMTTILFAQESTNSSFLTRNQAMDLFADFEVFEVSDKFQLSLPSEKVLASMPYQSGFMSFMANDNRLLNYPPGDLSDANDVTFGSLMNTSFDLGNTTRLNTLYIFDQSGRLTNTTTSFSFGKKKR